MQQLADRFGALWSRCSRDVDAVDASRVWAQLRRLYGEPHRHYHNLDHIASCLDHLDQVRARLGDDADAIELAIWFHDAVYSVAQLDYPYNEARSAAYFATLARGALPESLVARVETLILATTHKALSEDRACRYLLDIDLAGIGAPWPEFLANSSAIQREQESSPEEELAFLNVLDARDRIYQTNHFAEHLEAAARENITRYRVLCMKKASE